MTSKDKHESSAVKDLQRQVIEEQQKELFRQTMLQISYLAAKHYAGDAKGNLSDILSRLEKDEMDCFLKNAVEHFGEHIHNGDFGLVVDDISADEAEVEEELATLETLNVQEMMKFKTWFAKMVSLITVALAALFIAAWLKFDIPWLNTISRTVTEIRAL